MDPAYVHRIHELLVQTTVSDTATIKAATATLSKEIYPSPNCIPALFEILASSPDQNVRQLAAVELRKRVSDSAKALWTNVPQNVREQIKEKIPQVVLQELVPKVRHSTARVISAIASVELPLGHWSTLLPFVEQCCTSSTAAHREVGIYILFTTLETVVEGFTDKVQSFLALFASLLQDPESAEVRVTTLRAIGIIAQYIDADDKADIKTFQALVPGMLRVVGQCVEAGDEESARHAFDVFETLLILETPLLAKSVPQLVAFCVTAASNRSVSDEIRIFSLNTLTWVVKYKKSKIQSQNLAKPILEALFPIGAEEEPEDLDEDVPARIAIRIIDSLATALPPSQVFPPLSVLVLQYMSSPDPSHRKSAMMALGVSVEGCSEYMRPHMADIWKIVEPAFVDGDASVRKAACIALGCICEWLEEEVVKMHATLLPAVLNLVNDPATQSSACTALDSLLEIFEPVIDQYLPTIMERLSGLLDTAPVPVKAVVTGAIGSAAHASKEKFLPYFGPIMAQLQPFLLLTNENEENDLRGLAMDAIGTFADSVGKEAFRPYFSEMMKHAFLAAATESARLRECAFIFFGVAARTFEEEFAPYLPGVVAGLLASCRQVEDGEESSLLDGSADAFATGDSSANAIRIVDPNESGEINIEDVDINKVMKINSAIAVEKEIAGDTFGTLFAATQSHFLPYVEPATKELLGLLTHYYEGIRKSAISSLLEFIRTLYDLSNPTEWSAGKEAAPLHETVQQLLNHVLPELFDAWENEDDKSVASALCQGIAETLSKLGPSFLGNRLETVCTTTLQILQQKSLCQQDPDQDDDDEAPEDQAEFDSVLISAACDLVAALASALGRDFAPAFRTFYPEISKYYRKTRSLTDRSTAIGCLGEIITGMKGGITEFTEPLLQLIGTAFSDEEPEVRSNAAFAMGVLIENTDVDLTAQYPQLLQGLRPFFSATPTDPQSPELNARDNAAGAVARMIIKSTSAIPLEQVLPVLFGALPLTNDYLENRPVFRCIFHLFRTNHAAVLPYIDQLLPVFAHVLDPSAPDQIGDEIRADLLQLVGALNSEAPAKIQATGLGPFVAGA